MTTLRKVEMLKEACEMLSDHAQQLEEMAKDPHLILNKFSVFAHSKLGNGTTMGNWVAIFFLPGSGMLRKQRRKLS